jgi:predicted HicB family RNase H-like nuclease
MCLVNFRVPVSLRRQVKLAATSEDKSVQDWMKEAAEAKLRAREKVIEPAAE